MKGKILWVSVLFLVFGPRAFGEKALAQSVL